MPPFDSTARKQPAAEPEYRTPPHNIEAEQALLGAILVNNEAFYRVSDFLEPKHFFEPIHQRIYELTGEFVRAGKVANPVTLKTFLPLDLNIAGLSLNYYLARLAAEATTQNHIEEAEKRLYEIAETGRYESGFQRFAQALTTAVDMAANAYQREGGLSGLATGLTDLDTRM